jgi:hypothetical protein
LSFDSIVELICRPASLPAYITVPDDGNDPDRWTVQR